MWKHVVANFLTVAIVGLVALAALVGWARGQYTGPGPLAEAICLKVEKGSNFRRVADDLAGRGAVEWPYIFKVGADYAGRAGDQDLPGAGAAVGGERAVACRGAGGDRAWPVHRGGLSLRDGGSPGRHPVVRRPH